MHSVKTRVFRKPIIILISLAGLFALSAGVAAALGDDLADHETIVEIGRSEGLEIDVASIKDIPESTDGTIEGLTMKRVEYLSSIGPCEDLVLTMGGRSGSVGHCGDNPQGPARTLAEADLSSSFLDLNGNLLLIVQGKAAPATFPAGTSIEVEMPDGMTVIVPVQQDGRFIGVVRLASANDVSLMMPSAWRAVSSEGTIIDEYRSEAPSVNKYDHDDVEYDGS